MITLGYHFSLFPSVYSICSGRRTIAIVAGYSGLGNKAGHNQFLTR